MKWRNLLITLFVLAAVAVAVLAGIGTGDSFESDGDLWGRQDTAAVEDGG